VAERSLFMWDNEKLIQVVKENKEAVMPLIVHALLENIYSHWNM